METAYVYIKERILNNTYKPSQKLTEIQLADEIGVSRNTIKKSVVKTRTGKFGGDGGK